MGPKLPVANHCTRQIAKNGSVDFVFQKAEGLSDFRQEYLLLLDTERGSILITGYLENLPPRRTFSIFCSPIVKSR